MNRKFVLLIISLTLSAGSVLAQKYFTKTGTINFTAGTALEDIDANNKSVTCVFDAATGQIEFAILIKGFEFKRGLMQEHFNENYLESDKYPKSTFKGKFDVSKINFTKDGDYATVVKGTLEIHNVKREIEVPGMFKVDKGVISSTSTFKILLADYKIEIPGAVKDKISPTVEIQVSCDYKLLK
ncbi:MAG TPA: YceI family protein [Cytophagales bacterium]|jgi:polyisoprenoid-binding protein YceI|nr:YceI family protein [Cytophagales bacterium]